MIQIALAHWMSAERRRKTNDWNAWAKAGAHKADLGETLSEGQSPHRKEMNFVHPESTNPLIEWLEFGQVLEPLRNKLVWTHD